MEFKANIGFKIIMGFVALFFIIFPFYVIFTENILERTIWFIILFIIFSPLLIIMGFGKVKEGTDNIYQQSDAIQKAAITLESISQKVASQAIEVNAASGKITAHLENAKEIAYTER